MFYGLFAIAQSHFLLVLGGAESEEVSRRVLRRVQRSPLALRWPQRLLMPGGRRAIGLGLILGGIATLLAVALLVAPDWFTATPASHFVTDRALFRASTLVLLWLYSVIYATLPLAILRFLRPFLPAQSLRSITLAAVPLGLLLSGVLTLIVPPEISPVADWIMPVNRIRALRWNRGLLGDPVGERPYLPLAIGAAISVALSLLAARWAELRRRRLILESLHG